VPVARFLNHQPALNSAGDALVVGTPVRALVLVDVTPSMSDAGVDRVINFMSAFPNGFASLQEAQSAVTRYLPHRNAVLTDKDTDASTPSKGLMKNLRRREDGRFVWVCMGYVL